MPDEQSGHTIERFISVEIFAESDPNKNVHK